MEIQKKCSSKEHQEINANLYCIECKIYMCNKCEKIHSNLCQNHHTFNSNENLNEIFTGFCLKDNHYNEFKYFCKTHNQLCCLACIPKIKCEGYGQHTDCDICLIKEIKDDKKNKLKKNIKFLEELSNTLEQSINDLKNIFEKINKNKEELKLYIQKIFTKIRNVLNDREDKLLLEIDKQINDIFCNEDLIKESEKLPNKIKISLKRGKLVDKEWNNNELNLFINDCINIENNIEDINIINNNIKKINNIKNTDITFLPNEVGINKFLENIKIFGKIYYPRFKFRKCPQNINENRKYTISGENKNIFTKNGSNGYWSAGLCEYELEKDKEYRWKIKILKSGNKYIMIGVAPIDYDINSSNYNCGWYFYSYNSCLYSGPPFNYNGMGTNLSKVKEEIIIVMNLNKRSLKFLINNEDKGESYTNIPLDKPIVPAVIIHDCNDSVEIIEC